MSKRTAKPDAEPVDAAQFHYHAGLSPDEWSERLDFPDTGSLIELLNPAGREWLAIPSYPDWDDRVDHDDRDAEYRHIWVQLLISSGLAT